MQAAHQSLHHFVAKSDWSDAAVLRAVRARVLPLIEQRGSIRAFIIDDTGMPKKGGHSVGVARQYCGQPSCLSRFWLYRFRPSPHSLHRLGKTRVDLAKTRSIGLNLPPLQQHLYRFLFTGDT